MAERVQIETVKTDAFTMDYFRFGHGKETLVILPGLSVQSVMNSADTVARAYRSLTGDHTIYVFDRRKELPAAYSVYEMARDTIEAFRVLGLHGARLFGASQGGMIAMVMAIERPDLVKKLILCSASARVTEDGVIGEWTRLAKAGNAEGLYLSFGEALYPPDAFETLRAFLTESAKSVTAEELRRFTILAEGTRGFDVTGDLARIACPVFLIGSKDDRVIGGDATARIAECLKGRADLMVHMYDGYGHAAYDTAPDFKERMLAFLMEQ